MTEKLGPPYQPEQNIPVNQMEREKFLMEQGRQELLQLGINPDDYQNWFSLMQKADAPMGQALAVLQYLDGVIITPAEAKEVWLQIKQIINNINLDNYNEISGRDILREVKSLTDELVLLLENLCANDYPKDQALSLPPRLTEIKNRLLQLKTAFGDLPAYLAFRKYGIYQVPKLTTPGVSWSRQI